MFFFGAILGLILIFLITDVSFAFELKNPLRDITTVQDLIEAITEFAFEIAIVLATLMFIISGFFFVTAMGEPDKIKKARNIILYTFIGLIIVLVARGLVVLISEVLTSNNT